MIHYILQYERGQSQEIKKLKTKQEKIIELLNVDTDKKFIIFSNYNETFDIIRDLFYENNIQFTEIYGNFQTRSKQIDSFKKGNIQVLFMNSYENNAGINLQEASDIILYHKMPEDFETQIIGRAHRIGRKIPLTVHHLI